MERSSQSVTALGLSRPPLPSNKKLDALNKEVSSAQTDHSNTDQDRQQALQGRRPIDPNMDPKRLRRVLASRQYSQKYRMKQMQYIIQLETEVKSLQAEVALTGPRIKYTDRQNALLQVENSSMKQKIASYSGAIIFKEAQSEELKRERDMMKQFYMVNQFQYPEVFKTVPSAGNYPFVDMSFNQYGYNPCMEPSVGTAQTMMDQDANHFGGAGQRNNFNSFS